MLTIEHISLFDLVSWLFLFLVVTTLGLNGTHGFFARDLHHPIYEYSIGNSYHISIFNTPDLSYSGKNLNVNFLTTQIPSLFTNLFHSSILESIYLVSPLFLLILSFILITSIFSKYDSIKTPIFILFLFPIAIVDFYYNIFTVTIFSSISYFVGFLLMIIAIFNLKNKNYLCLTLAVILLTLVKSTFAFVILGGIFLYFLRKKEFGNIIKILLPQSALIFVLLLLFIGGAHKHNLWIFFPYSQMSIIYSLFIGPVNIYNNICLIITMGLLFINIIIY